MALKPFFSYFGSKYRIAGTYPRPLHDKIIEPFAGGAGYSLLYPERKVLLVDVNETIVGIWQYLIRVSGREILALPDLQPGQTTADLNVAPEARDLIGFWLQNAVTRPARAPCNWMRMAAAGMRSASGFWGHATRRRLARQVASIRHWQAMHGSYAAIANDRATWFVDPPYYRNGAHYVCNEVDYRHLSAWCRTRRGQTIVCEEGGASWLPFVPHRVIESAYTGTSQEVVWLSGCDPAKVRSTA